MNTVFRSQESKKINAIRLQKNRKMKQTGKKIEPKTANKTSDDMDTYSESESNESSDTDSKSGSDSNEETEQEDEEDYAKGGYHPVKIGETFKNKRYEVIRKLGWGQFSTVWLCFDRQSGQYVAIKVVKSQDTYTETALDEIKLLKCVRDADSSDPSRSKIVQLLDDFKIQGVHGEHICIVFEVMGYNLLKVIMQANYKGIPLKSVKVIARQILEGLQYLHEKCSIIHTDIKPENILVAADMAHIENIAEEAKELYRLGKELPSSAVINAPKMYPSVAEKVPLSKNKKKKAKKKAKKGGVQATKQTSKINVDLQDHCSSGVGTSASAVVAKKVSTSSTTNQAISGEVSFSKDLPISLPVRITRSISKSGMLLENSSVPNPLPPEEKEITLNEQGDSDKSLKSTVESCEKLPDNSNSAEVPVEDWLDKEIKIADLGNACWTNFHFTDDVQTRQYRSLEVILGADYGTSSDIWSAACLIYELATGEYLFDPKKGDSYSRDDDHLALMIECLGPIAKSTYCKAKHGSKFFDRRGKLHNVTDNDLRIRSVKDHLLVKLHWTEEDAENFTSFLLPMLIYDPDKRATAKECLRHQWLNMNITLE